MESSPQGLLEALIAAAQAGDKGALAELDGIAFGGNPTARKAILAIDNTPEIKQLFTNTQEGS